MKQMSLTLEAGISARNRTLREHLAQCIYSEGLVAVAGKLDLSPSRVSEKLAGVDSGGKPRGMTVDELERYIDQTGDVSPIHYLVEKYLHDPVAAQQEALHRLAALSEQLPALLAAAGLNGMPKGRRR